MNRFFKVWLVIILILFSGFSCKTDTVLLSEGPAATQLNQEKDNQIQELKKENESLVTKNDKINKEASLAAANFDGILYGAEHVETGLPRNAIEEEAKLGKTRLESIGVTPNPEEIIKAKDRVIAILENNLKKKDELYQQAFKETNQTRKEISKLNGQINGLQLSIKERDDKINKLEEEKKLEQEKHKEDVTNKINQLQEEIKKKELDWVMKALGLGAVVCILGGIILVAISKGELWLQGGILSAGGGLIMLIRAWYITLINQSWFPILCGIIFVIICIGIGWGIYKIWVKLMLNRKKTAAIQDYRDESESQNNKNWNGLEEHLKYRLGDKSSYWGKQQLKETVQMGLNAQNHNNTLVDKKST